MNESKALAALSGLREAGAVIGQDASVIAYDDINVSAYFAPPLTTFYPPIEDLGRKMGEFLLRRLGGEVPAQLTHVIHPKLVFRQDDSLEQHEGRSR